MSGEQTPGEPADLVALRATAMATKKQADDAAAALLAADPSSAPLPAAPGGPPPALSAPGIDLAALESFMARAIAKSTEGLRDGITAITRENTSIKASQARLESQRRRVDEQLDKSEGKTGKSEVKIVSPAKQLDFTEDLLASLESIKDLALGIVLDKPAGFGLPVGPAPPSQAVCKIADYKDGVLLHELLEEIVASSKAKLKGLTIVWNAPSYRVAFEAIRGCGNTDGTVGEDAMKETSEAVTRVDKLKRKDRPGWGDSANKSQKPGGWGSNYSARVQEPAQPDDWEQGDGNAHAQSWNGGKGQGQGGEGKGKTPYPPAGGPPLAFFGDNAALADGERRGRPGPNQCA